MTQRAAAKGDQLKQLNKLKENIIFTLKDYNNVFKQNKPDGNQQVQKS